MNIRPFLLSRFPLPIALAFLAASLGMFAAAALEPTKGTTLWWVRFFSASGCTLTWIAYLVMFDWTRGRERGRRDARLGALATVAYWFLYTGVTMVDQPRVAVVFVPLLAVMIVTYFKAIPKLAEVSRSEAPTGTGRQLDGDDPV